MVARQDRIPASPLLDQVAAISCGIYQGNTPVLDLDYDEDSTAETDANFVVTGSGDAVEIQATGEKTPFSEDQFLALLGAGAQRHREAGEPAKAGGGVSQA